MENIHYTPDDSDITFYIQVYRDFQDAEHCLKQLRLHYRTSRVIIISDGDNDSRYERLSSQFNTEYRKGERLYPVEHGGRMLQRMFDAFLEQPSSYLIKLDTDTRVHRRLQYTPRGKVVFGTLEWETHQGKTKLDFPNIQGGCLCFTLDSARAIADSKLLLSERLLDYRETYADNPDIIARAQNVGLISSDFVIRYVCRQLNIPFIQFDEVKSLYRGRIPSDGGGFAVTHPHKSFLNKCRSGQFGALASKILRLIEFNKT